MSVVLTAFTKRGILLALQIAEKLKEESQVWVLQKHQTTGCQTYGSLSVWTEQQFQQKNDIIFVSAVGIAVRSVAPFLRDKLSDPGVLAVDEMGRFVVPLVSGHVGGANDLARKVARLLHAQAVISTATDLNDLFAVDEWATQNNMTITDRAAAKQISAHLLAGQQVLVRCEFPHSPWTAGITEGEPADLVLSCYQQHKRDDVLVLHPRVLAVGIGCKKNLPKEQVMKAVEQVFRQHRLSLDSIFCLASIELKQNDEGICYLSNQLHIPSFFFTSDELNAVEGDFSSSMFVHSVTGVDCVCERAAVLASGGTLLVKKTALSGITIAVAQKPFFADFKGRGEQR